MWPEPDEVELHWARLDDANGFAATLPSSWLSTAERDRAARFATPDLAKRWSRARCFVRHVLSRALRCSPSDVDIELDTNQRPLVRGAPTSHDFNISHTDHVVVVAVAGRRVGVDVEPISRLDAVTMIRTARTVSSEREHQTLRGLVAVDIAEAATMFTKLWVRKEAVLKAVGSGFLLDPRGVHVGVDHEQLDEVVVGDDRWSVSDVALPASLSTNQPTLAAVATQPGPVSIRSSFV